MPKTAEQRRKESIEYLHQFGITSIPESTLLPEEADVTLQPAQLVAQRTIILDALSATAFGVEKEDVVVTLEDEVWNNLSDWENGYFSDNEEPSEEEVIDLSWKIEAAKVLLWALNILDDIDAPKEEWDMAEDIEEIILRRFNTLTDFYRDAQLRSKEAILDQADRVSCAMCTFQELNNDDHPFEESVVYERNHALQWLIVQQEWE